MRVKRDSGLKDARSRVRELDAFYVDMVEMRRKDEQTTTRPEYNGWYLRRPIQRDEDYGGLSKLKRRAGIDDVVGSRFSSHNSGYLGVSLFQKRKERLATQFTRTFRLQVEYFRPFVV